MQVTKNTVAMRVIGGYGKDGYHKLIFVDRHKDKICLDMLLFKSILRGLGAKLLEGNGAPACIKRKMPAKEKK